MSDLRDLYQEIILDHNKSPRNFGRPSHFHHEAHGDNPLCGDRIAVYVTLDSDRIQNVAFEGRGCAISTASASLMTDLIRGKTLEEARALFRHFQAEMTGRDPIADTSGVDEEDAERLAVLAGVKEFPMRVKCATLSWHTLMAALEGRKEGISTETTPL